MTFKLDSSLPIWYLLAEIAVKLRRTKITGFILYSNFGKITCLDKKVFSQFTIQLLFNEKGLPRWHCERNFSFFVHNLWEAFSPFKSMKIWFKNQTLLFWYFPAIDYSCYKLKRSKTKKLVFKSVFTNFKVQQSVFFVKIKF